jgi:hypothetical protein
VYENAGGSITIRQEADCEDQDPVIVIIKANVPDLVRALVRVARVEMPAQLPPPAPGRREKRHGDNARDADSNGAPTFFADA